MLSLISALAALTMMVSGAETVPNAPTPPAADPTPHTAQPTDTAKGDNEIVCKTIAVTGTRFGTKQCHTKADWAAQTAAAREFTQKATNPMCGTGCKGN